MDFARKAVGSAAALIADDGRVVLLRRAYPPGDWVMPGGNAEANESPVETVRREIREEIGLEVDPSRMTGVYYQRDHRAGEFIHFVFSAALPRGVPIEPDPSEVADWGLFARDALPEPMSTSTRIRLLDALEGRPQPLPAELPPRAE